MKMLSKKLNNKGFTIIELIVVIAVLGILVLLAAPRYMGYTKDANVAGMKADVKVLQNVSLIYNIDNDGSWPVGDEVDTGAVLTPLNLDAEEKLHAIDAEEVKGQIGSMKNDIDAYAVITSGAREGEVFHIAGVEDREGVTWYGVELNNEVE